MPEELDRHERCAQDLEKFRQMRKFFSNAETKEALNKSAMLYILDMSYPRPDISLALKAVEMEKGWR
jgi:hypothetical protein